MKKTAFFDLKGDTLSVYAFGKNGQSGLSEVSASTPVGDGYAFTVPEEVGDAEESYLSLPLSLLNFRVLELPFSDIKKVRELLPFELDGLILGGSESSVFDASVLGEENGKYRVLVACIGKKLLGNILGRLKEAGFDPRAVVSVELAHALRSAKGGEGIAEMLLSPAPLADDERRDIALKEVLDPVINLRRDKFVYTADTEKTKKSLKITTLLSLALLLVFLSDMGLAIYTAKRDIRSYRDEIRKTYTSLFPNEKKISDEAYLLKAHISELREKESSFTGVSPLKLLLDLSRITRPGVSFSEIAAENELVILKGDCPSLSDAEKIKKELEEVLRDVSISDTKPSSQNRTVFTITAKGRKT